MQKKNRFCWLRTSRRPISGEVVARGRVRVSLLGPAFIAAIGYIDPGNFATNIQSGSTFGYQLLWVVVLANLMAMVAQLLSAKLGIATGKNLAEQIRDRFPSKVVWGYWVQAEVIAMATDLAEFIGAALGFKLLFGVSLIYGALLTAAATCIILSLQRYGQKTLEVVIAGFLFFVAAAYVVELVLSKPDVGALIRGVVVPSLPDREAVYLASAVMGATVMPHVIYLHSALTQDNPSSASKSTRYYNTRLDVAIAMTIASFVNFAMMAVSAAVFHSSGHTEVVEIESAYVTLQPLLGQAAAKIFALSLIAAGLSSTVVGTLSGQVVMQGFVHFRIPIWVRRLVTMLPSFVVILLDLGVTKILMVSQVVLSFGIALALIPLLYFTEDAALMGELVNGRITRILGRLIATAIVALNVYLLATTLF